MFSKINQKQTPTPLTNPTLSRRNATHLGERRFYPLHTDKLMSDINRFDGWFLNEGRQSRITTLPPASDMQMSPQSRNIFDNYSTFQDQMKFFKTFLRSQLPETDAEYIAKLGEDVCLLIYHIVKSDDMLGYSLAIINFVKLRYNGSLLVNKFTKIIFDKFKDLFTSPVQGAEEFFASIRGCLNNYVELRNAPIFKKLYKFSMYVLSLNLFSFLGVTFSNFNYTKVEAEAIKSKHYMGHDFIYTMLDTIVFLCERGFQCMKTGSMDPIYHSGGRYEEWLGKANTCKQQAVFLNNPEPHGIDRHSFIASITDLIDQGTAMHKHATRLGDVERRMIAGVLAELVFLKSCETTKRAAQKTRVAPFALLFSGPSSMGKSTLTDIMFNHYGRIKNLPTGSEFKYSRNFADPFWSGFNSSQWCVVMDDVAFMHPNIAAAGDPSLMEIIQVVNNVPFIPNQAELADKGRTPMLAKFVIATTNTEHLNAYAYFSCPLAVRRRLPYIVDVSVKAEYAKDGIMLDHTKVPPLEEGSYPDYWHFNVKRIVPDGADPNKAKTEDVEKFNNIYSFLCWFNMVSDNHDEAQKKVLACGTKMTNIDMCPLCRIPSNHCTCPPKPFEAQNGVEDEVWERVQMMRNDNQFQYLANAEDDTVFEHASMVMASEIAELRQQIAQNSVGLPQEISDLSAKFMLAHADHNLELQRTMSFLDHSDTVQEYFDDFSSEVKVPWFSLANWKRCKMYALHFGVHLYCEYKVFRCTFNWLYTFPILRRYGSNWLLKPINKSYFTRRVLGLAGNRVQNTIGICPLILAIPILALTLIGLYKLSSMAHSACVNKPEPLKAQVDTTPPRVLTGKAPKAMDEERENVWYKNDMQLSVFDVPTPCMTEQALLNKVKNNCAYIRVTGDGVAKISKMLCVGGQLYICNNHSIPMRELYEIQIIYSPSKDGVTTNLKVYLTNKDLLRQPNTDLVFLKIPNMPVKPCIYKFFCSNSVDGIFSGKYISRERDGSISELNVENIKLTHLDSEPLNTHMTSWFGRVKTPTQDGDCGSALVVNSHFGAMIFGIHYLGKDTSIGCIRVTKEMVQVAISHFDEPMFAPSEPLLEASSAQCALTPLHPKSIVRYSPQGVADVYGSCTGSTIDPKSHVQPTFISEAIQKKGYVVKTGPPAMKGWAPWYNAMQDIFQPVDGLRTDILASVTDSFIDDIIPQLTPQQLTDIHPYDDFTAINGAPGVSYVDKMNRNTSAGFPWNKSKKYFMSIDMNYGQGMLPVVVDEEIMCRVYICEQKYKECLRYMPVFTGHLKDEAKAFKKIKAQQTRLFMGAPMCWTIVVRKYTLAFTRLIQNNRFLFESAPGTIAQSLEWEQIYEYLVAHGCERIVAGDYAKFDKRMPPCVTLQAFRILISIAKAAGWEQDDINILWGIAYDTCFPLAKVRGDMYGLFGSNPSGHPLTVIINGLVNGIYMRYCFYILSGLNSANNFKKLVNLITYGDDNAMGVSHLAPWFNHTAIQQVLAEAGIGYTMAEKTAQSVPYIHIDQCSFLKRTWRFDENVGALLCPLEHDSIEKMLTMCVKSKTITPQAHAIAVIRTALYEYFFYGKEVFEEKSIMMREIVSECDLELYVENSTFPTYGWLKEQFWKSSKHLTTKRLDALGLPSSP